MLLKALGKLSNVRKLKKKNGILNALRVGERASERERENKKKKNAKNKKRLTNKIK